MKNIFFKRHDVYRHRLLALFVGVIAFQLTFSWCVGQDQELTPVRIGVVLPLRNTTLIDTANTDFAAEAARMGAVMGGDDMGVRAQQMGVQLDVLFANAPTPEAAERAAKRLIATEGIVAIIGGLGSEQAEVLHQVANNHEILFFNIGSPNDALRGPACGRYTFHIEASEAMYLDAIAATFSVPDDGRWFVIYPDSDEGQASYRRAREAINSRRGGAVEIKPFEVASDQFVYSEAIDAIRATSPDAVLVMLDPEQQAVFLSQYELFGLDIPVGLVPDPISQTRQYLISLREGSPNVSTNPRIVLWETTLELHGADELNGRFMSRWGEPMDPAAWAAYQAVKIIYEAFTATGSLDSSTLVSYLESPDAVFDVQKGREASFRPWDHQLRQPLYVVQIDPKAQWGAELSKRVDLVDFMRELPTPSSEISAAEQLDELGEGPEDSQCQF